MRKIRSQDEKLYDLYIGNNIKLLRSNRKISQRELGKKIGLSSQQLSKYEIGKNRISAVDLYEISKVLEVPISIFFSAFIEKKLIEEEEK